ncbi:MAG: acetate kinase [Campylobacterales bacterium]|nr:acetate kinase [Campylobacterales bacterium]
MKVLVLNSGSSSIKFQIFDMTKHIVLVHGLIDQIGEEDGHVVVEFNDKKISKEQEIQDHHSGLELAIDLMIENRIISSFEELGGVGHRVVHGGEKFDNPTLVDDSVLKDIEDLIPLAPLHNPANLDGIKVSLEKAPNIPNVAVFDTAFHQTIPQEAYLYALPYELYEKKGVRRYGFHGTSHKFVAKKAETLLGKHEPNLITLHLGNGASACAIKGGKSVDTSMGFTPLEGLIMGTRSGDLDPAIIPFLEKSGVPSGDIDTILNKKSGLKGICGLNDMREIFAKAEEGDEKATLAIDMFCYRIRKYIGSYAVLLGKVDGVIFTGGIGEHAHQIREKICFDLECMGIDFDHDKNLTAKIGEITKETSKTKVFVIPTNEELEIAMGVIETVNS